MVKPPIWDTFGAKTPLHTEHNLQGIASLSFINRIPTPVEHN